MFRLRNRSRPERPASDRVEKRRPRRNGGKNARCEETGEAADSWENEIRPAGDSGKMTIVKREGRERVKSLTEICRIPRQNREGIDADRRRLRPGRGERPNHGGTSVYGAGKAKSRNSASSATWGFT